MATTAFCNMIFMKSFPFINLPQTPRSYTHRDTPSTFYAHIINMLLFLLCIGNLGHFTIFIKWTCFIHTSDIMCVHVCVLLAAAEIIHLKSALMALTLFFLFFYSFYAVTFFCSYFQSINSGNSNNELSEYIDTQ